MDYGWVLGLWIRIMAGYWDCGLGLWMVLVLRLWMGIVD